LGRRVSSAHAPTTTTGPGRPLPAGWRRRSTPGRCATDAGRCPMPVDPESPGPGGLVRFPPPHGKAGAVEPRTASLTGLVAHQVSGGLLDGLFREQHRQGGITQRYETVPARDPGDRPGEAFVDEGGDDAL